MPLALHLLLLFGLATWRIAYMLARESGPWSIFDRLRYAAGIRFDEQSRPYATNEFAAGLTCVYCNSVWVGTAWAILYLTVPTLAHILALPFALSGLAILAHALIERS